MDFPHGNSPHGFPWRRPDLFSGATRELGQVQARRDAWAEGVAQGVGSRV